MRTEPRLQDHLDEHPFPLLFATISGADLYGFPSADSDYDLRGVHLLPLSTIVGLDDGQQTVEKEGVYDGLEIDLVTHDAAKFFGLLLKNNGYVLEQVFSPLVVQTSPAHEELKSIASKCVTRHHVHHYRGFAASQWKMFRSEPTPRVKPLLYVYRVLLTGIHLMQTGRVESNIQTLNESAGLSQIDELIEQKVNGAEKEPLKNADLTFHESEYERLVLQLERAAQESTLPAATTVRDQLNDLLVRIRLQS